MGLKDEKILDKTRVLEGIIILGLLFHAGSSYGGQGVFKDNAMVTWLHSVVAG